MLELILVLFIAIFLAWCLAKYLSKVMTNQPMVGDGLFRWIENPVYRLLGISPQQQMNWKQYSLAFVVSCVFLAVAVFAIFMTQAWLPLNPNHAPNMSWDLALHTVISFLTNTNQQHYSGQAQLSYLSQMTGIVGLQVITPMMGLAFSFRALKSFFLPAPKPYCSRCCRAARPNFNWELLGRCNSPYSPILTSALFCLVFIAQ
ncbi:potassium-transporting ATPase A subunit [Acinetobacter baumannii 45002_7]|nr:potassium-transporting ATPase A subunit [Acinetobacter baumannii 45002_7]